VRRPEPPRWVRGPVAAALPGAVLAWVVAAAALTPAHALRGVHSFTGTGYDDGVYLGASVRLLHGALPWLDHDLLHPPGIVWLGLPFAALGELTDASTGLAAARVATALVAGLNVLLAGAVVRSRGRLAVFVTATTFALMPTSYAATQTFLLEPYLVLFSLAGLALLTKDGEPVSGRRLVLAGAAIGVATAVKVFGVLVALGVLLALLPRWRAVRGWSLGVVLGFAVLTLPLAVAAPGRFLHDVVLVQLRRDVDQGADLRDRLPVVLGLEDLPGGPAVGWAPWLLGGFVALVALGVVLDARRDRLTRLHVVTAVTAAVALAAMLQPRQFFDHYAYFLVALLALPAGLAVAAVYDELVDRTDTRRWPAVVVVAALLLGAAWSLPGTTGRARDYTAASADPGPLVRSLVPRGSCVATDLITTLLVADRLDGPRACDVPLDPYGLWFADNDFTSPHTAAAYRPEFVARWRRWLDEADYAVLSVPYSNFVPWTPELRAWFDAHYVLVGSEPATYVYLRLPVDRPAG
jgi:hypothetical protein